MFEWTVSSTWGICAVNWSLSGASCCIPPVVDGVCWWRRRWRSEVWQWYPRIYGVLKEHLRSTCLVLLSVSVWCSQTNKDDAEVQRGQAEGEGSLYFHDSTCQHHFSLSKTRRWHTCAKQSDPLLLDFTRGHVKIIKYLNNSLKSCLWNNCSWL